jgi:hypothetical protein
MSDGPTQNTILSTRQFAAALAALTLSATLGGAIPLLRAPGPSGDTEKAVERIADELSTIRRSLVTTQIDTTRALATAMEELSDHARRIERLEDNRRR